MLRITVGQSAVTFGHRNFNMLRSCASSSIDMCASNSFADRSSEAVARLVPSIGDVQSGLDPECSVLQRLCDPVIEVRQGPIGT